jgi:hypothetical protein
MRFVKNGECIISEGGEITEIPALVYALSERWKGVFGE